MKKLFFTLAIFTLIACSNVTHTRYVYLNTNPNLTNQEIVLSGIKNIINNSDANIIVTLGNEEKLIIECDSGIAEFVTPYITQKTLIFPEQKSLNYKKLNYYLTLKNINSIEINNMGDIIFDTPLETNELEIRINGAGDLLAEEIDVLNLNSIINGSGNINIKGEVTDCDIIINGSGNFYGLDLTADYVNLKSSGAGDLYIEAKKDFNALLKGSGDVHLKGHPENYKSIKTGSGDIKELD